MTAAELTRKYRPWLLELPRYVPGTAPPGGDAGKLSSNEMPAPPPPEVVAAATAALARLNRYPEPLADTLRERLAMRYGVDAGQLLIGNGSDELIQLLAHVHLGVGALVVLADPPYLVHEIACRSEGATVERVPLREYHHDLPAMAEVDADVVFLANPHNPTGTAIGRAAIEAFLARSPAALVVIDEAYIDFADEPEALTALPLVNDGRVVVLRTFSKMAALAGARVGFLAATPELIGMLRRVRAPFSVNAPAQAAASASLDCPQWYLRQRDATRAALARMRAAFVQAGFCVAPSQANFLLVRTGQESDLVARLERVGLSVRPGGVLGAPGHVRVSVGADETIERLEAVLAA